MCNDPEFPVPTHEPTTRPATHPEARARSLFGAVIESWAGDCLRLRAAGLDRPSWRTGAPAGARPLGPRDAGQSGHPLTEGRSVRPRWAA
ncbi:MAG: hypothetical protein DHS20C14_14110 [Phycisphaeraceae bacterium]|nr:MAG: hypothetical protein DHS20C14_14110 [Phycisphaeraceae bacterium]